MKHGTCSRKIQSNKKMQRIEKELVETRVLLSQAQIKEMEKAADQTKDPRSVGKGQLRRQVSTVVCGFPCASFDSQVLSWSAAPAVELPKW